MSVIVHLFSLFESEPRLSYKNLFQNNSRKQELFAPFEIRKFNQKSCMGEIEFIWEYS